MYTNQVDLTKPPQGVGFFTVGEQIFIKDYPNSEPELLLTAHQTNSMVEEGVTAEMMASAIVTLLHRFGSGLIDQMNDEWDVPFNPNGDA